MSGHDGAMPLPEYAIESFSHHKISHEVYRRGTGPMVLIAPELRGITPLVAAFGDRLVGAGFSVAIPSLFGTPGKESSPLRSLGVLAKFCITREFKGFALRDDSAGTDWLRALARHLNAETGGNGIGFVGMCFTGGFGLAMMLDDDVIAPVLSQPAVPYTLTQKRQASLGLDDAQLRVVAERAATGCDVLGLRFTGDPKVGDARFQSLRDALGDNFICEEIISPNNQVEPEIAEDAHSVLTGALAPDSIPEHPTQVALTKTMAFLCERLQG